MSLFTTNFFPLQLDCWSPLRDLQIFKLAFVSADIITSIEAACHIFLINLVYTFLIQLVYQMISLVYQISEIDEV